MSINILEMAALEYRELCPSKEIVTTDQAEAFLAGKECQRRQDESQIRKFEAFLKDFVMTIHEKNLVDVRQEIFALLGSQPDYNDTLT